MENLHVKYEFSEAIDGKKYLLSSEANLLRVVKRMQTYKTIRLQEIRKKQELKTKLNDFVNKITLLQKNLPKAKIPKIDEDYIEDRKNNSTLEQELKDIQEKLARLG